MMELPRDYPYYFKVFDADTYTTVNDFIFSSSTNRTHYRLDQTGIFHYLNPSGSPFTLYSSLTEVSETLNTPSPSSDSFIATFRLNK